MSRRGFTLVELLVVISIIAVLSVVGITIYTQVTRNARDARRKLDLQNIAQALEVYYQKNNRYPVKTWTYSGDDSANINTIWINGFSNDPINNPILVPTYISLLPVDPKINIRDFFNNELDQYGYAYCSKGCAVDCYNTAGQYYILMAKLENTSDPDRKELKKYKWCDGTEITVWSKNLYIITPNQ